MNKSTHFLKMHLGILLSVTLLLPQTSKALISGQAMVGMNTSDIEIFSSSEEFSGTTLGAAVHLDPIPLVPVGFGIEAHMPNGEATISGNTATFTGVGVDFQVTAWTPIAFFGFKPFAKLGYIFGAYKIENIQVPDLPVTGTLPYIGKGTHMAAGFNYSFIPLISLLFQVSLKQETLGLESGVKIGDSEVNLPDSSKKSTDIIIGIEAGI